MTFILPIANQAGSAGKTTTTIGVAGGLAKLGRNIVIADGDGQANASYHLGIEDPKYTLGDLLLGRCTLEEAIVQTKIPGLWIIPSAERQVTEVTELARQPVGAEQRMRRAFEPLIGGVDGIIIDCPGSLDIITVSAFVAAKGKKDNDAANVVTVIAPQVKEVQGIPKIERTIEDVRNAYNPRLQLAAIIPCMIPSSQAGKMYEQVVEQARALYGDKVSPVLRRSVRVPEAYAYQLLIQDHAPDDAITKDLNTLTDWFIEKDIV
ncbi:ParA family protein [Kribbella sp. NPDC048928]|uniref:ParA family protein n=1 Tax=Kribbella sp. NPDC048928 TaxID=3364111 RepID=UPI00370F814F